jgi:hypothetical protein
MSEGDYFLKARKDFKEKHEFVARILSAVGRLNAEPSRLWANLLFFRLAMVGNSLLVLCIPGLRDREPTDGGGLDHSSVAALARNLLEAQVMFLYITDPKVSEHDWLLRRAVLELHDCTTRYRMLKDIGDGDSKEAQDFKSKITPLKNLIASSSAFRSLNAERQEKVLTGQELYVAGLRAVVKEAGWDVDHFNAMYSALSSYAHSSPASFYRSVLNPNEPDPGIAPDHRYVVCGLALEYTTEPLGWACERMFLLYPEVFLKGETKH